MWGCLDTHLIVTRYPMKTKLANYNQAQPKPKFILNTPFKYPVLHCKNVQNIKRIARQKIKKNIQFCFAMDLYKATTDHIKGTEIHLECWPGGMPQRLSAIGGEMPVIFQY